MNSRDEKALIIPPRVPVEGRDSNWSQRWGRNDFALIRSQSFSFVSCSKEMEGFISVSSASTSLHLSLSFRPRMFQDAIRKFRLIIRWVLAPKSEGGEGDIAGIEVVPALS